MSVASTSLTLADLSEATLFYKRERPRWLLGSLVAFGAGLAAALLWATFTRMEESVKGAGVVRPAGGLVRVDALEGGRVLDVGVREGEPVETGALLVRLARQGTPELEAQAGRLQVALAEYGRRLAELDRVIESLQQPDSPCEGLGFYPEFHAHATRSIAAAQEKVRQARERWEARRRLQETGVIARSEYQDREFEYRQSERELEEVQAAQRARAEETAAALRETSRRAEWELADVRERLKPIEIRAPAEGVVADLRALHGGMVLQPGQAICSIAPEGAAPTVEAIVATRHAGSLEVGQPARVQLAAYRRPRYQDRQGTVSRISPDSAAPTGPSEGTSPTAGDRYYRVEIRLEPQSGARVGEARQGMTAEVHVVTRRERVIVLFWQKIVERFGLE